MEAKIQALLCLLARLSFHQAVVFCNSRPDAEYLAEQLVRHLAAGAWTPIPELYIRRSYSGRHAGLEPCIAISLAPIVAVICCTTVAWLNIRDELNDVISI